MESLHPGRKLRVEPASADASFRRYFRVFIEGDEPPRIVMEAPVEHEDCRPFVHAAGLLHAAGINAPRILASDLDRGFLLLTDLGRTTYLQALTSDPSLADTLYRAAIEALVRMQSDTPAASLPPYDEALLMREMRLFPDWYMTRHRGIAPTAKDESVLARAFGLLVANNLAQPRVFVHRDYHSRNLMLTRPGAGEGEVPGVLDFQDAVRGPITYDLVSLLKDAYIEWEEEQVLDWAIRYWESARTAGLAVHPEFGEFYRDFEWMGLQRHLKILGIFARLNHRDGKAQYLDDLPLVMRYTRRACERYDVFTPLLRLLDRIENTAVRSGYTF